MGSGAPGASAAQDDEIQPVGLFSGPGGTLRNNTRKGRPAPAITTSDVVSEDAFKQKVESPRRRDGDDNAARTTPRQATAGGGGGFDDDAWNVKPARAEPTQQPVAAPQAPARPSTVDDMLSLSLQSPPLQPTPAPAPIPPPQQAPAVQQAAPTGPQQPQGADQAIFDKIAALAPQPTAAPRQRPQPPTMLQQAVSGGLGVPMQPPPRAASAPGFQNPHGSGFGTMPLQAQLTGYPGGFQQNMMTGYPGQQQPQFSGFPQQQQGNGFLPQPTGVQAMQQNYPALQPQPTGIPFQPQSSFGLQAMQTGFQPQQQQQAFQQPQPTGFSPFADPTNRQQQGYAVPPMSAMPTNNSYTMPPPQQQPGFPQPQMGYSQQTGFPPQQQQQPAFAYSQQRRLRPPAHAPTTADGRRVRA